MQKKEEKYRRTKKTTKQQQQQQPSCFIRWYHDIVRTVIFGNGDFNDGNWLAQFSFLISNVWLIFGWFIIKSEIQWENNNGIFIRALSYDVICLSYLMWCSVIYLFVKAAIVSLSQKQSTSESRVFLLLSLIHCYCYFSLWFFVVVVCVFVFLFFFTTCSDTQFSQFPLSFFYYSSVLNLACIFIHLFEVL